MQTFVFFLFCGARILQQVSARDIYIYNVLDLQKDGPKDFDGHRWKSGLPSIVPIS